MGNKYSKPVLSRRKFIEESGYPEQIVDRALHSKRREYISFRTSDAANAKSFIYCDRFEECMKEGEFV